MTDVQETVRCDGRYPVPQTSPPREEPFEVTYRCNRPLGHTGPHGPSAFMAPETAGLPTVTHQLPWTIRPETNPAGGYVIVDSVGDYVMTIYAVRGLVEFIVKAVNQQTELSAFMKHADADFVRAEQAEAQLSELQARRWHSIETAPKDGTPVRLKWDRTTVEAIGRMCAVGWPHIYSSAEWRDVHGDDALLNPTHWTPVSDALLASLNGVGPTTTNDEKATE